MKTMLAIKTFQMGLRANPDCLNAPHLRQAGHCLAHQCMPNPGAAHSGTSCHTTNARFGKHSSRIETTGIRHQTAFQASQQMHGLRVGAIHVLKNASLLDYKNLTAQLKYGIKLRSAQLCERHAPPLNPAHANSATLSE
ncbi:hypothetical protein H4V98_002095 [Polaromonas sp. CG_23.6]|nr:hypothetical protein [Polaromonas sp. CG_23.6]